MRNVLAAAAALTALAMTGTAHADVAGPRCDIGGNPVVTGVCVFGHPSFTSLSVSAEAVGVPGLATVHISVREFSATTGIGALVLECSDTSDGVGDPTAGCAATVAWSGAGQFVCQIDGAIRYTGSCSSTVTA